MPFYFRQSLECIFFYFGYFYQVIAHDIKIGLAAYPSFVNAGSLHCSIAPQITGLGKDFEISSKVSLG